MERTQYSPRKMQGAAIVLSLKTEKALPPDISSTVYGLKDGVAFVRHKAFPGRPNIQFRVLPITLDEWSQTGLIIPFEQGEISLAKAGVIKGLGHVTFVNCSINEIQIPYAELSHLKYGDTFNAPTIERTILDFQLTLLGLQTQTAEKGIWSVAQSGNNLKVGSTSKRIREVIRRRDTRRKNYKGF